LGRGRGSKEGAPRKKRVFGGTYILTTQPNKSSDDKKRSAAEKARKPSRGSRLERGKDKSENRTHGLHANSALTQAGEGASGANKIICAQIKERRILGGKEQSAAGGERNVQPGATSTRARKKKTRNHFAC